MEMRVKEFTKFLAFIALCIALLVVGRTYRKRKLVRINQLCTGVLSPMVQLDCSVWFCCGRRF
jgi:hypothetical protein